MPEQKPPNPRRELWYLLYKACSASQASLKEALHRDAKIAFRDFSILSLVAAEVQNQSAIGQELGIDLATVSSTMKRLEKQQKLVKRLEKQENNREYFIVLTPMGMNKLNKASAVASEAQKKCVERLTEDEVRILCDLLDKMCMSKTAA